MPKIFFESRGEGTPVILLHGFPMSHKVWDTLAKSLSENFKVYTPDLPGFGQSTILPSTTLETVADELISWINENKISRSVLIGHSLGGYVALAMVEKSPQLISGLGLFHSTAMADSEEKKESRTKTIEFIRKNGVLAFTSHFIQSLFADPDHPAISSVRAITVKSTEETVVAYTRAMRDRPDRQHVLQDFKKPILLLGGEKDQGIPTESLRRQAQDCHVPDLHILPGVAHMGMFEKPHEVTEIIRSFVQQSAAAL